MNHSRGYLAACLWMVAFALNTYAAVEYEHGQPDAMLALGWGLFFGQMAMAVTGWCLMEHAVSKSDVEVDRIVEVVDALHSMKGGPRSLR